MKTLVCVWLFACTVCLAAEKASLALPRSAPERQGISSSAILEFVEAADKQVDAMHSFMLVRHGQVVAEGWWSPYGAQTRHSMFSLSKSFTSTAVGLAVADGKLSVDDEVLKFLPEDAPAEPGANLKSMRVQDLLRMSTGQHAEEVAKFSFDSQEKLTKLFLSLPVEHKPGTHFYYNTPATYMASAIVQKATGMTVFDYLRPRLFDPLGIENPTWESRQGITFGGSGLHIRTEDIARLGQLYLQEGKWHGQQLVPAAWVEAATARQTSNGSNPASDWEQGYGYQFWRCRHGCYRGDGAFGQFCIVMPEQDSVVAITSGTRNLQGVLNLVWDKLLPAMTPRQLGADDAAQKKLAGTLAGLTLHVPQGNPTSKLATTVSGKKYLFPTNDQNIETIALEFGAADSTLVLRDRGVEHRIALGHGSWRKGTTSPVAGASPRVIGSEEQSVAGSGAWAAEDTYAAKLAFYETPLAVTLTFKFAGQQLFVDTEYSVSFGATKQPQLTGQSQ
jgi:CubicO group peptidase (beta-lactamase class C family)